MGLIFDTSLLIADEGGQFYIQIAAAGLTLGHEIATLNVKEFQRVAGLRVVDATSFRRS